MRDTSDPVYLEQLTSEMRRATVLYETDMGTVAMATWEVWRQYPQVDMVSILSTMVEKNGLFQSTLESLAALA